MTTVHVICCNDRLEYAVVDNKEKAEKILLDLKEETYERIRWNYARDEYDRIYYWHIHSIPGSQPL